MLLELVVLMWRELAVGGESDIGGGDDGSSGRGEDSMQVRVGKLERPTGLQR